jgi:hypothetical protein
MSASVPRLVKRVSTLMRQPWTRKRLVVEAAWDLAVARLSVVRRGQFVAIDRLADRVVDLPESNDDAPMTVRDIGWAVEAGARTLPWNTLCLTQAIAAGRMLARRDIPSLLHVGLDRDDRDGLRAHAWVTAGRKIVVGGAEVGQFARLTAYAPRRASG